MKILTFEQTRGIKTFHLPFRPNPTPHVTLMVRKNDAGDYEAGLSVCSLEDNFVRRLGRLKAYGRLVSRSGPQFSASTPEELMRFIDTHLLELDHNRPGTVNGQVFQDLLSVEESLEGMSSPQPSQRTAEEAA